ncbi:hypothetical protein P154DRAFT_353142 [Amniculicola lignicola CBS 123094]|uniref:Uncharacterized protein n=1 Tax=Amniculicola lignicola CBS 123094 TaxID=1392246 RepID=A0A6A5WWI9_9PLEO|nr:hypothetical protein P154DRAFT_353142 [Amniculicola lignicola CBS 123094]
MSLDSSRSSRTDSTHYFDLNMDEVDETAALIAPAAASSSSNAESTNSNLTSLQGVPVIQDGQSRSTTAVSEYEMVVPQWQHAQLIVVNHTNEYVPTPLDNTQDSSTTPLNRGRAPDGEDDLVLIYPSVVAFIDKPTLVILTGTIEGGSGPREIKVCRTTVRKLSTEWNNAVDGVTRSFWPSKSMPKLEMFQDEPTMLYLIMQIAHCHFAKMPKRLSFRNIVDLAIICNKYNSNHLLIPFLSDWVKPYKDRILEPGMEEWVFVAYQFGFEDDYLLLIDHLLMNCTVDDSNNLINPAGHRLTGHYPRNALAQIKHARQTLIQSLLTTVETFVTSMITTNACTHIAITTHPSISHPSHTVLHRQCTYINKGSVERYLGSHNYWPIPPVYTLQCSINTILNVLENIQAESLHEHEACHAGRRIKVKLGEVMAKCERPTVARMLEELRINGGKCRRAEDWSPPYRWWVL